MVSFYLMNNINMEKYTQVILYLLNRLGKIEGKKKLYKLLYYVDFDSFEKYDTSITGDEYKALPMGPVGRNAEEVIRGMDEANSITTEEVKQYAHLDNPTVIYKPKQEISFEFTENELDILNRVVRTYGHLNGSQLERLSHSEAPYNSVEIGQLIPYEFALYRNTEDL